MVVHPALASLWFTAPRGVDRRRSGRRPRQRHKRSRPAGGCSIISRSTIARRSPRGGSSTRRISTRWTNSPSSVSAQARGASGQAGAGRADRRGRGAGGGDRRQGRSRARSRGRPKTFAAELLAAYPVPLAPAQAPDLARGAALYAENCASCHGAQGRRAERRSSPSSTRRRSPSPTASGRASAASFGLYQVITQGLEGTAMQSFASLPEEDRWALAFHAGDAGLWRRRRAASGSGARIPRCARWCPTSRRWSR